MKKSDERNDGKVAKVNNQAETIFRRELAMLSDDVARVEKILQRFELYSHDIKGLDRDEADEALLWLVDVFKETILAEKSENPDKLWSLSVCLRKVYDILPVQYNGYLFPKTKKEMLKFILEQWDVKTCDKHGQEILLFIWEKYTNEHPLEERNAIDTWIKERLDKADRRDVDNWIAWIHEATWDPEMKKKYGYMHTYLGRLFAIARARAQGLNGAWWDVRREKIVDALGIRNVGDNILSALCYVCLEQITLLKDVHNCMEQIMSYLLLKNKSKTICRLGPVNKVEISIKITNITEIPGYADIFTPEENFANIMKHILDEFERLGVSRPDGRISFRGNEAVNLELFVCDALGKKMSKKEWYA